MPNSSSTVVVDSSQTTNAPAALAYGFVWVTGKRLEYYMLQNTGNSNLDFTRLGFWALGEGEWDGCEELWINDNFIWGSEYDDPTQFHFHRGTDSTIGIGVATFSSVGPDQGTDSFWQYFPSAVNPLNYSRLAYYGIFRKQPIENQTNNHQNDPTQWTDVAPIGLWRSLRVRLFDASGNQTGYAFTRNPVWHWVDLKLRRRIFPEYNVSIAGGIDPVPAACLARFNWADIYASATYCGQLLANGRPRFSGDYAFAQQTTTTAIEEVILRSCRGFTRENAGKMSLLIDQPRASVFTFNRTHIMPGSFAPSDRNTSSQANSYVGKFRDLLIPAIAEIASITCSDHRSNPVVSFDAPHPFNAGDRCAIGGTDTIYDGVWTVASVPSGTNPTTLALATKGSNYPAGPVGSGGTMGLLYSRFKERAPTFWHQNNQFARGAVGVGIARQMNAVPVSYDFCVSTFDQVSRIMRYERDRALGLDVEPYVLPGVFTFKCPMYALDGAGSGAVACQIQEGDRVTFDSTADYAYQGDYEVLDVDEAPFTSAPASGEGTITQKADPEGGQLTLTLAQFNEAYMYDSTDPNSASWSNVPGSDPGNDGDYTAIDLADNGKLAFLTLSLASGATFDLPSTGFNPANLLAWAGPQGYIETNNVMHVIALCNADPATRRCILQYEDGQFDFWNGDLNIAAATWIGDGTAASLSNAELGGEPFQWLTCTLAGGEVIAIGCGVVPDGTVIALPSGFSWYAGDGVTPKAFAMAFPHDASPGEAGASGNQAHGVGAYVDSTSATVTAQGGAVAHLNYQDGSGHTWHGNASLLIFAWKNNSGAVSVSTSGGLAWMEYTTSTGFVLGVGMGTFEDSAAMTLPAAAGQGNSLQVIAGPHDFQIVDHPAHGVGACYVDAQFTVHCMFEDGEGNQWTGHADVFALFYEPTGGSGTNTGGISVTVTPAAATIPPSATQQFSAMVAGSSNTAVTWSVDGVGGGNSTVGFIDTTGLYTAPATSGTHQITATSQANTAAEGWQFIQVGTGSGGSGGSSVQVVVSPGNASVAVGGQQQFTATVTGVTGSYTVVWAVDGIAGGNSTVGTIDSSGLFTAPLTSGGAGITAKVGSAVGGASVIIGNPGGEYAGGGGRPIQTY